MSSYDDAPDKSVKGADDGQKVIANTSIDRQRLYIDRLMKNPEKPVFIPAPPKQRSIPQPRENRNIMGSSAGAGSGEFHVYRQLRRREQMREKIISSMTEQERLDYEFEQARLEKQAVAESKTAKKRQKREKKKERKKLKVKGGDGGEAGKEGDSDHDADEDEDDEEEGKSAAILNAPRDQTGDEEDTEPGFVIHSK